uniref:Uncharacterized protein n=1 Tax=Anguilla anguilla TaxID=7936 RepID=A0A0E9U3V7_ANGAN
MSPCLPSVVEKMILPSTSALISGKATLWGHSTGFRRELCPSPQADKLPHTYPNDFINYLGYALGRCCFLHWSHLARNVMSRMVRAYSPLGPAS